MGFVDLPLAHIAHEASPGRKTRRYWQADVKLGAAFPNPTHHIDRDPLFAVLGDVYKKAEFPRLSRAISHYHAALRHWTQAGQPLALAHLYPALEALGPAFERRERQRLGRGR